MKALARLALLAGTAVCLAAGYAGLTAGRMLPSGARQAGAQTQAPDRPATIQVRVRLIPVDVIATDAKNRPVTDLRKEDFQIFENGRRQEIRHFAVQSPESAAPEPALPLRAAGPLDLAPQSARTFLILIGRGRIQRPFGAVDAVIRFVRKDLLPQDRVAVFAYNRATAFTTDHEAIARILEQYKTIDERIESWFEVRMKGSPEGPSLAAIFGSRMPESFQAEVDRIFVLPEESMSRQVAYGQLKATAALGYAPELDDIGIRINPVTGADPLGPPQIRVDFQIEAGNIGLKAVDGFYVGRLHAAVFCADARGNYLGDNWGAVDIKFEAAKYPEILRSGIRFSVIVPHKVPQQVLKAVVYDSATDRLGSKLHRMLK